jgi:hypothetical protein
MSLDGRRRKRVLVKSCRHACRHDVPSESSWSSGAQSYPDINGHWSLCLVNVTLLAVTMPLYSGSKNPPASSPTYRGRSPIDWDTEPGLYLKSRD